MKDNQKKKRFVLDFLQEDHKQLKLCAIRNNMTMKQYVIEAIAIRVNKDKEMENDRTSIQ